MAAPATLDRGRGEVRPLTSDFEPPVMVVVNGPIRHEIGMNADVNLFGPGNRANATIGRATRLILRNVFQMLPRDFR